MNTTLLSTTLDKQGVCTLTLNRPKKHNALNNELIAELSRSLVEIEKNDNVRVVVITGSGNTFSSGADIEWMRSMAKNNYTENHKDALQMANLFYSLYHLNKPTIAYVNGSAFGGAIGLIACCDIAIAVDTATFAFTEVRLGIVPAVISPYIVHAIGARNTKQLFLSARKISANEAIVYGVIHKCVSKSEIDEVIENEVNGILQAGVTALRESKTLIHKLSTETLKGEELVEYTAKLIAEIRISKEGQEGLHAFLEKRRPNWLSSVDKS